MPQSPVIGASEFKIARQNFIGELSKRFRKGSYQQRFIEREIVMPQRECHLFLEKGIVENREGQTKLATRQFAVHQVEERRELAVRNLRPPSRISK